MIEIEKFNPCEEALDFRKEFKTFEEAWEKCSRGDWMLWIAARIGVDHRLLTLAKAMCAKTVIHLMKDERSINAVNVAEKYGRGEASKEDLKDAHDSAYAAATYAYAMTIHDAYDTYAAAAACAAADEDYTIADYAVTYASIAYADAHNDSRVLSQDKTADICREILTDEVLKAIKLKTK